MEDIVDNYNVKSKKITYFLDEKKIITAGSTIAEIDSKYYVESKDVTFNIEKKELSSKNYSIIKDDNSQIYNLDEFLFAYEISLLFYYPNQYFQ